MLVIVPFPLETVDEADPPLPQGILKGTGLHELRFILIAAEVSNRFKAISRAGSRGIKPGWGQCGIVRRSPVSPINPFCITVISDNAGRGRSLARQRQNTGELPVQGSHHPMETHTALSTALQLNTGSKGQSTAHSRAHVSIIQQSRPEMIRSGHSSGAKGRGSETSSGHFLKRCFSLTTKYIFSRGQARDDMGGSLHRVIFTADCLRYKERIFYYTIE